MHTRTRPSSVPPGLSRPVTYILLCQPLPAAWSRRHGPLESAWVSACVSESDRERTRREDVNVRVQAITTGERPYEVSFRLVTFSWTLSVTDHTHTHTHTHTHSHTHTHTHTHTSTHTPPTHAHTHKGSTLNSEPNILLFPEGQREIKQQKEAGGDGRDWKISLKGWRLLGGKSDSDCVKERQRWRNSVWFKYNENSYEMGWRENGHTGRRYERKRKG